jgi:hypothetical protein
MGNLIIALMLLGLATGITSSSPPSTGALPPPPKATWLWHSALIGTSEEQNDMLQFAVNQHVGYVFLKVNENVARSDYRNFIQAASVRGIQVYALDGAPDWALRNNRQHIDDLVDWVNDYNSSVPVQSRFMGIQVDIEPYLLPEWSTDQDTVAENWREALVYFHELVKKSSSMTTVAAVPFWLDEIPLADGSGTLSEAIMAELDETAVMSYRDQAQNVANLATEELAAGDRLGKQVWIGVETNPAPDTPYITFYGKGGQEMDSQLALIDGLLKGHSSYTGIAIHDYTGWRALGD